MHITIVGTGYVGLVTGTCFADTGNQVVCVDIDTAKVRKMQAGEVPIYEPQLETLFARNVREGRLHFTDSLADGLKQAEVVFLALPTPPGEDGSADLSYILGAASDIGKLLHQYVVIVDKSTVPVGTAKQVREKIAAHTNVAFDVVSNPEFLREGLAVSDFLNPDRIIVGTTSKKATAIMGKLYQPFVSSGSQLFFMDEASAELTKYAANSFLVTKISFMNEIATMCELLGADVDAVRVGLGSDTRIGPKFLHAGIGYGGSCFPKDVTALEQMAKQKKYDFKILAAVHKINSGQKMVIVDKLAAYYNGSLAGKKIAVWGLAFKPDTDDVREAPSFTIVQTLAERGARVIAYDPQATANFKRTLGSNPHVRYADDMYAALQGADALIIVTEWESFKSPDFTRVQKAMKQPVVFDGRNIYALETMRQAGFHYESIGRPAVKRKQS